MQFQSIWMTITHYGYGYDVMMEFIVDVSDHLVTHVYFIIILKAGIVHGGWLLVRRLHRYKESKQ
jgi:hypothetical protein